MISSKSPTRIGFFHVQDIEAPVGVKNVQHRNERVRSHLSFSSRYSGVSGGDLNPICPGGKVQPNKLGSQPAVSFSRLLHFRLLLCAASLTRCTVLAFSSHPIFKSCHAVAPSCLTLLLSLPPLRAALVVALLRERGSLPPPPSKKSSWQFLFIIDCRTNHCCEFAFDCGGAAVQLIHLRFCVVKDHWWRPPGTAWF